MLEVKLEVATISFFSFPLFYSLTKGKHKLRKSYVRHSKGRRSEGDFPVHSQVSVCSPARPWARSAGLLEVPVWSAGGPHVSHQWFWKMQSHTIHPQLRCPPGSPQTAPTSLHPPGVSKSDVLSSWDFYFSRSVLPWSDPIFDFQGQTQVTRDMWALVAGCGWEHEADWPQNCVGYFVTAVTASLLIALPSPREHAIETRSLGLRGVTGEPLCFLSSPHAKLLST